MSASQSSVPSPHNGFTSKTQTIVIEIPLNYHDLLEINHHQPPKNHLKNSEKSYFLQLHYHTRKPRSSFSHTATIPYNPPWILRVTVCRKCRLRTFGESCMSRKKKCPTTLYTLNQPCKQHYVTLRTKTFEQLEGHVCLDRRRVQKFYPPVIRSCEQQYAALQEIAIRTIGWLCMSRWKTCPATPYNPHQILWAKVIPHFQQALFESL